MKLLLSTFLVILMAVHAKAQLQYPPTRETPVVDTYHGIDITDDYQWLEKENSEEV